MNQSLIVVAVCFLLLVSGVSACGPSVPTETPPAADQALEVTPPALEAATVIPPSPTTDPLPVGYPPEETSSPAQDPDYPGPPTLEPTIDPYPDDLVWVIRPVGIQCENEAVEGYSDLQEAVATLSAAGVAVSQAEMTDLMVTAVCGAPTSAHYLAQISYDDLDLALSMDWEQR